MPRMTQAEQKAAILSGAWPYYPVLCMKRYDRTKTGPDAMECGLLIAPQWNVVYLGNLFLDRPRTTADIRQYPKLVYTDLDELLGAGWVGD